MLAFKTSLSKKNKNLIFTKFKEALDFFFLFFFLFTVTAFLELMQMPGEEVNKILK